VAIAKTFRLDPVDVMEETDTFLRASRVAALMLSNRWDKEAADRAKRK
jgi:hypothetical protein